MLIRLVYTSWIDRFLHKCHLQLESKGTRWPSEESCWFWIVEADTDFNIWVVNSHFLQNAFAWITRIWELKSCDKDIFWDKMIYSQTKNLIIFINDSEYKITINYEPAKFPGKYYKNPLYRTIHNNWKWKQKSKIC